MVVTQLHCPEVEWFRWPLTVLVDQDDDRHQQDCHDRDGDCDDNDGVMMTRDGGRRSGVCWGILCRNNISGSMLGVISGHSFTIVIAVSGHHF